MKIYKTFLVFASALYYASASDIRGNLTAARIHALFPGDPLYSGASQAFNRRFTFKPAAVTYPSSAEQVAEIVKIGAAYNHRVVARSGGHSYIANGLGGKDGVLVVDLKNITRINVSSSGTATIETGNRLGDVALALNKKGRALPHGTCPYVGIGGHSGYGGFGFTSRMWGLTLDTILSLDVVLADGTITTVSRNGHADLFWAMRGASGSYGIVTSIKVKTFPAPASTTVFQYSWHLKATEAAKAVAAFQKFVETDLPKEFDAEFVIGKGSEIGSISFGLTGGWYGPADKFNATIAPYLKTVPKPESKKITVGSYINSVKYLGGLGTLSTHNAPDTSDTFYVKSLMTPEQSPISVPALNAFMKYMANEGFTSNTDWFVEMELYGGKNSAINAVPLDATAFGRRNAMWTIQFYASSSNHNPPYPSSGFTFLDNMVASITKNSPPNWDYGAYANYIDDRLSNWQTLYYASHYARLQQIKREYDFKNVFSFPLGIEE
ncbi:hypothetical protein AX17_004215 [Amanita inopinata Kibby_2008]|nr:hypothetical protein AX17_004215 [Amanita inopinata Kibby_2008]